jgi:hypothetical protein
MDLYRDIHKKGDPFLRVCKSPYTFFASVFKSPYTFFASVFKSPYTFFVSFFKSPYTFFASFFKKLTCPLAYIPSLAVSSHDQDSSDHA